MTSVIRRLLALALASSGALVAATAAPAAAACENPNATLEQQTVRADAVFTGTVGDRSASRRAVTYEIDVDLVHKGDIGEQATVRTPRGEKACGVPDLENGQDYVWFVTEDGDRLTATRDGGTTRATSAHVQQVEGLLGEGTSPTPPVPVEATFTTVAGEQTELSRLAAPGVALVLVGLLGLLLVAALGRRKA
jgi:hypothetical protein